MSLLRSMLSGVHVVLNGSRFIIRDEPFGYTLFDRTTLRHKYLHKSGLSSEVSSAGLGVDAYKTLVADVSSTPRHILYSPIRVYFEITSQCNLRCRICFNLSGTAKVNELSRKGIERSLEGLRADNVIEVRFCGGEPTQRPDWYSIVRYAQELGFSTSINSNGVYDHPDSTINKLTSLGLDQIAISIDGDRDYHDFLRGEGSFDKAIRSIRQLHEEGARVRVNTILTRGSLRNFSFILESVAEYIEEINFFYLRPVGRAAGILDEAVSYDELCAFDKSISMHKASYPGLRILHGCAVMTANSIDQNVGAQFGLSVGGPDGFTRLNLLPDGAIWPGGYTPHIAP
ncbi:hypothetical protein LCGC14_2745350, partial [marine sediment metagenome]